MSDGPKVVPMPNRNYLGNADMAEWMRLYADEVEAGKYGELVRMVVITESDAGKIDRMQVGIPTDRARLVGMLEFTKHLILTGGEES